MTPTSNKVLEAGVVLKVRVWTVHVSVTVNVLVTLVIMVKSASPTSTWMVKGLPVTAVGSVV